MSYKCESCGVVFMKAGRNAMSNYKRHLDSHLFYRELKAAVSDNSKPKEIET